MLALLLYSYCIGVFSSRKIALRCETGVACQMRAPSSGKPRPSDSPAGLVGCLSAETGTLKWFVELTKRFQCDVTGFGYACSPSVIDGLVLLPVGGSNASMVALDAKTGEVRWQSGSSAGSYAPAFPISFHGRRLVLGYLENSLVGHDRSTGELLWTHELSQGYDKHSLWPRYQEPFLWISSPFQAAGRPGEPRDR